MDCIPVLHILFTIGMYVYMVDIITIVGNQELQHKNVINHIKLRFVVEVDAVE